VHALRYAAVVLAGLLTGSELTSRLIVHPAPWRLPHDAQVKAEKLMYRRFGSIDPFLMTGTVIVCFLAAAAGCFTLMLAITLALNMPINPRSSAGTKNTETPTGGGDYADAATESTPHARRVRKLGRADLQGNLGPMQCGDKPPRRHMPTVIRPPRRRGQGSLACFAEARGVLRTPWRHQHPDVRRTAEPRALWRYSWTYSHVVLE
jgi:hypothetical protein